MKKNETDATKRIAAPIPFYDLDGALKPNLTFDNGSGECFTYRSSTNDWVASNADAVEVGGANTSGIYKVQMSQAETNYDSLVGVKLVKSGYATQYWFERVTNSDTDSLATSLAAIAALLHHNSMVDNQTYDAEGHLLSARIRRFSDATALTSASAGSADDADGEIWRGLLSATVDGDGNCDFFQIAEDLS